MPLFIVRNDITKINVDAIVNAANNSLLGGGGVDGAIHRAAGGELLEECRTLGGCETGKAKITKGYKLPAKYVIHTVGPIWYGGNNGEAEKLASCYRESLHLAKEHNCQSIAFPTISTGIYRYPKKEALDISIKVIEDFLKDNDMDVYIVMFGRCTYALRKEIKYEVDSYIDDNYVAEHEILRGSYKMNSFSEVDADDFNSAKELHSLNDAVGELDESFSDMVLRKIDEKGIKDSECYKKANMDRKLFSKIRSNSSYRPKKQTALALAVALELSLDETCELLEKAGYAISHSRKFDVIVEYFIKSGNYNISEINEALFCYNQNLLG